MSNYTIVTNFLAKDSLISGNPLKLVKGADFTTEFTAVQSALNSKFDGSTQFAPDGTAGQPSFGFTNNAGTGMYNAAGVLNFATGSTTRLSIAAGGLVTASLGLTVAGAAFISRGITDNSTATSLTISASGGVTIAPASGTPLTLTGTTNNATALMTASSTSGQSLGLLIRGGTTAADYGLTVANQAGVTNYFQVLGDGSVVIGNPTGGAQGASSLNVGTLFIQGAPLYVGAPQNVINSTYTTVLADANKHIFSASMSAAQTITIAANASVAYPIGTMISGVNRSANAYTLACGDTLQWAPSASTGSRTIAANAASWTAIKVQSTVWMLTGVGIT